MPHHSQYDSTSQHSSDRGCNHRQLSLAPVVICKVVRRERQFPANPCLGVDYGLRPFPKGWVRAQGVVVVTSSAGTCWMVGEGGDSEIVWPHPVSGALLMLVTYATRSQIASAGSISPHAGMPFGRP